MNARKRILAAILLTVAGHAFAADTPVDINTATPEALAEAITGVGIVKARAIVDWRERNGPFAAVDDLLQVQGIGERTLERSRERLTVGPQTR